MAEKRSKVVKVVTVDKFCRFPAVVVTYLPRPGMSLSSRVSSLIRRPCCRWMLRREATQQFERV
jgi:hypothetical protein